MAANPDIEITTGHFTTGIWWWASVRLANGYCSSGYSRSREVAVRKLKRKLDKIESELAFAQAFLKK